MNGITGTVSNGSCALSQLSSTPRLEDLSIAWDGRIDNRQELLTQLNLPAGTPDPVLLLHGYRKAGPAFIEQILGDFAFLLWDSSLGRLMAGRDRIGVKPLYYFQHAEFFAAASEIKALLTLPQISREADDETVLSFLAYRNFSSEDFSRTFFKDIRRVAPGHYLLIENGRISDHCYWQIDPSKVNHALTYEEAVQTFASLLRKSVQARMRDTQNSALYLSGGLDSSAIAGLMHECMQSGKATPSVHAINMYSHDPASDERSFAREVIKQTGFRYTELFSASKDPLSKLPETIRFAEAPLVGISGNSEPLEFMRDQGIRTLITGDGGDHLLDEDAFPADLVRQFRFRDFARLVRSYADSAGMRLGDWLVENLRLMTPVFLKNLKRKLLGNCPPSWLNKQNPAFPKTLNKVLHPEKHPFHSYSQSYSYENLISPYFVSKLEAEAHIYAQYGIELRYPMLDSRLVEWVLALPWHLRVASVRKQILRDAMKSVLPQPVRERKAKSGFTREMDEMLASLIPSEKPMSVIDRSGLMERFINKPQAEKMIRRYQQGNQNLRWEVWFLITVDTWLQTFIQGEIKDAQTQVLQTLVHSS